MFVGSMGADKGVPFMANEAGAKAYVRSLSLSLHEELKSHGIHVTVLPPASIETHGAFGQHCDLSGQLRQSRVLAR